MPTGRDQRDDESLEQADALVLEIKNYHHVERRQRDAERGRNSEQQVERDSRTDDLGEIAGSDGQFADDRERPHDRGRIVIAARLRQIPARNDSELECQTLEQDRHQVRHRDHSQQRVPKLRTASEIRRPVAGVHVSDSDEVSRPREGEDFSAPRRATHRDGPINLGELRSYPGALPSRFWPPFLTFRKHYLGRHWVM